MVGPANALVDVIGLSVGHAHDERLLTGVSLVLPDRAAVAAIDVRGGGPSTRESDALSLDGAVDQVHGIVLSGGSAFGLSAATGVQHWLAARGMGYRVGAHTVPIVPQAILFDLTTGQPTDFGAANPYEALAFAACEAARRDEIQVGSLGAGIGATTANLRGGLGQASIRLESGYTVAALVAVNALGQVTMGDLPHFWANALERTSEFGGLGSPAVWNPDEADQPLKGALRANTTIGVVACDAVLDKAQARRLAVMAQTGLARAIRPLHAPLDGDVVFAMATGSVPGDVDLSVLTGLGSAAADVLARAVARGVYCAAPTPEGWTGPPSYQEKFGSRTAGD